MAARPAATAAQKAQRELEDLQLVLRARNGDGAALDVLIRRYTGFVRLKASSWTRPCGSNCRRLWTPSWPRPRQDCSLPQSDSPNIRS